MNASWSFARTVLPWLVLGSCIAPRIAWTEAKVTVGTITQTQIGKGDCNLMIGVNAGSITFNCSSVTLTPELKDAIRKEVNKAIGKTSTDNTETQNRLSKVEQNLKRILAIQQSQDQQHVSHNDSDEVEALLNAGKLDQAQALQDRIAKSSSELAGIESYKAALLYRARLKFEMALPLLRRAHELLPDDAEIALVYADTANDLAIQLMNQGADLHKDAADKMDAAADARDEWFTVRAHEGLIDGRRAAELEEKEASLTREAEQLSKAAADLSARSTGLSTLRDALVDKAVDVARLRRGPDQYNNAVLVQALSALSARLSLQSKFDELDAVRKEQQQLLAEVLREAYPTGPVAPIILSVLECQSFVDRILRVPLHTPASAEAERLEQQCLVRSGEVAVTNMEDFAKHSARSAALAAPAYIWLAQALLRAGDARAARGRVQLAIKLLRGANTSALAKALPPELNFGDSNIWLAFAIFMLAWSEEELGLLEDSETHLREALTLYDDLAKLDLSKYALDAAAMHSELASFLGRQKRNQEALANMGRVVQLLDRARKYGGGPIDERLKKHLGYAYVMQFQFDTLAPRIQRCDHLVKASEVDPVFAAPVAESAIREKICDEDQMQVILQREACAQWPRCRR